MTSGGTPYEQNRPGLMERDVVEVSREALYWLEERVNGVDRETARRHRAQTEEIARQRDDARGRCGELVREREDGRYVAAIFAFGLLGLGWAVGMAVAL